MRQWSSTSQARLDECHPDLQILANTVLQIHDCTVVTGRRDEPAQTEMFNTGRSKKRYPDSKHNPLPSEAIDLAPYVPQVELYDFEYSLYFAGLVLGVADMLYQQGLMQYRIRWGGNWSTTRDRNFKLNSFYDGLHFELLMG